MGFHIILHCRVLDVHAGIEARGQPVNFKLDCICPTLFAKIFAAMKNCEQLWLVTGPAEIYQDTIHFRLKGNV